MGDIKKLDKLFKFRPECLRNMRVSNILLKLGAEEGLTLAQIGMIMCRDDDEDEPSILEQTVDKAERNWKTHGYLKGNIDSE